MKAAMLAISCCLFLGSPVLADELDERLVIASPQKIANDPALLERVETHAVRALDTHCTGCHGEDYQGSVGVPDLTDFEWIWGVRVYEMGAIESVMGIMQTILYGIRYRECEGDMLQYGACADTRYSEMPAYGQLGFSDDQLHDLTELVVSMNGQEADMEAVSRGEELWPSCTECHGERGWGVKEYGGPDLTDNVWLYSGERDVIKTILEEGSLLQCPPWEDVLSMTEIKSIAVYLYRRSLGY